MATKTKGRTVLTIGVDVFPVQKQGHHYYTATCAALLFEVDYEGLVEVMEEDGLPRFCLLPLHTWPTLAERVQ